MNIFENRKLPLKSLRCAVGNSKTLSMEKSKMSENNAEILKTKNGCGCGCIILLLILLPIIIALILLEKNWRAWDDFYSLLDYLKLI